MPDWSRRRDHFAPARAGLQVASGGRRASVAFGVLPLYQGAGVASPAARSDPNPTNNEPTLSATVPCLMTGLRKRNEALVSLSEATRKAEPWLRPQDGRQSPAVEVDPAHRDRLRVALEQRPRQRHLEVPVLERERLGRLAVAADDADIRPEGALLVQGGVFLAVLPQPHFRLPVLNRHRRIQRDLAVRGPEALQPLQVQPQHHRLGPGGLLPLDDRLADPGGAFHGEQGLVLVLVR